MILRNAEPTNAVTWYGSTGVFTKPREEKITVSAGNEAILRKRTLNSEPGAQLTTCAFIVTAHAAAVPSAQVAPAPNRTMADWFVRIASDRAQRNALTSSPVTERTSARVRDSLKAGMPIASVIARIAIVINSSMSVTPR